MKKITLTIRVICTLISFVVPTFCWAQNSEAGKIQNHFGLTGDVISFPLTLVNSFAFISGEINGVKGKFMFDTGHQDALSVNNNIIPLSSQKEKGNGFVASGQKYKGYINDSIQDVKLVNGLHYQDLKQIESANYDFLQNNITPDCIGYIGHDFFKGYLFKLDYTKRNLTFYKNTSARGSSKDFLAGEKVLAILDFEIRKLSNPMIKVNVNEVEILAIFDTGGSYGLLGITDNAAEKLSKKKNLVNYGKDGFGDSLVSLNNVKMGPQLTTDFVGIYKQEGDFSQVRKALGLTEDNYLIIASRFLAKYKTVWDYGDQKIYVLSY